MEQRILTVAENRPLNGTVYRMRLRSDTPVGVRPGQFIDIRLDGLFLRRPISVSDAGGDTLTILYRAVGRGTEMLREMRGGTLDVLMPLGNGFDPDAAGEAPLLVGGGIGCAPLFLLAKELRRRGLPVRAVLGFNTREEVFYEDDFRALGAEVTVTTADGSYGVPGLVTAPLAGIPFSYYYACGPEPMLRAVYAAAPGPGELSFEERMGCGFGACMGCTCATAAGPKRVCRDGPVLKKEELLWDA